MIVSFPDTPSGEELFDVLILYIDAPPIIRRVIRCILGCGGDNE